MKVCPEGIDEAFHDSKIKNKKDLKFGTIARISSLCVPIELSQNCVDRNRTCDLKVMSLASYPCSTTHYEYIPIMASRQGEFRIRQAIRRAIHV